MVGKNTVYIKPETFQREHVNYEKHFFIISNVKAYFRLRFGSEIYTGRLFDPFLDHFHNVVVVFIYFIM